MQERGDRGHLCPNAEGLVSSRDGESVRNLGDNGQVQKPPYCIDTSMSSAHAPLLPPCTTPVIKAPAVTRMLSSNLCLQAQYRAVSLGSTFGQESSYLVDCITRAPGCLREQPSEKGRFLLTVGAHSGCRTQRWALRGHAEPPSGPYRSLPRVSPVSSERITLGTC